MDAILAGPERDELLAQLCAEKPDNPDNPNNPNNWDIQHALEDLYERHPPTPTINAIQLVLLVFKVRSLWDGETSGYLLFLVSKARHT